MLQDAECSGVIDAALQPTGLCKMATPSRPALRYGMEATDLLLCLGGVNKEGVPSKRGGLADLSFCFAPHGRKTCYIPSPLMACGGSGQVTAGAVSRDNILVSVESEDQSRVKRVDIYRCERVAHCKKNISMKDRTLCMRYLSVGTGTIMQSRTAGRSCAQQHTGTCML